MRGAGGRGGRAAVVGGGRMVSGCAGAGGRGTGDGERGTGGWEGERARVETDG